MAMTVVERIRELGLLRAAGASRGQVVRIIVFQGLVLGVAGSGLGIVLGLILAYITAAWLRAAGSPTLEGPAITPLVLAGGPIAGFAITLVAAFEPARRAAGVSPVAVLRSRSDPSILVRSHTRWLVAVVVVLSALSMLLLPGGSNSLSVPLRALLINAVLLFAVLIIPPLLGPLSRICGLPFRLFSGFEERLARGAIRRDPGRTALTAGALVAGISMVVALASIASTTRFAATAWLGDVVPGDEVLTSIAPIPFDGSRIEGQLLDIDGVVRVTPIAAFDLARDGLRLDAVAIHGADFLADGRLSFTAGDRDEALRALDTGGAVVVPAARAARLGVGLGSTLQVASASGLLDLKVVGLVARSFPGRSGDAVLVGWSDAVAKLGVAGADSIIVRYDPAKLSVAEPMVDDLAAQLALTAAPASRIAGAVGDSLDKLFGLMDLLAIAAVAIAGLGILNTLSMDTRQRLRELGMLRAAGMSRSQVWRSVLIEAGILGAVGGALGCATGIAIGVLLTGAASGGLPTSLSIPWPTVAAAFLSCIVLAMLAAFQPARMAGRVSIVAAVRGE
jgi:putative ABC transport system permease protein